MNINNWKMSVENEIESYPGNDGYMLNKTTGKSNATIELNYNVDTEERYKMSELLFKFAAMIKEEEDK